jgi:hypothetical protein
MYSERINDAGGRSKFSRSSTKILGRNRLSHAEMPLASNQLAARICGVLISKIGDWNRFLKIRLYIPTSSSHRNTHVF